MDIQVQIQPLSFWTAQWFCRNFQRWLQTFGSIGKEWVFGDEILRVFYHILCDFGVGMCWNDYTPKQLTFWTQKLMVRRCLPFFQFQGVHFQVQPLVFGGESFWRWCCYPGYFHSQTLDLWYSLPIHLPSENSQKCGQTYHTYSVSRICDWLLNDFLGDLWLIAQWFCPRTPAFPKPPQSKTILYKLLVKGPGYLPGVCGWDLGNVSVFIMMDSFLWILSPRSQLVGAHLVSSLYLTGFPRCLHPTHTTEPRGSFHFPGELPLPRSP